MSDADVSTTREESSVSSCSEEKPSPRNAYPHEAPQQRRSNRERSAASVVALLESLESTPTPPSFSRHKRLRTPSLRSPHHVKYEYAAGSTSRQLRTDSPDRHFRCNVPGCTKSFKRSGHLKRHRLVHLPPAHRERFRCCVPSCNKHYSTKYDLAAHMRQAHEDAEVVRCTFRNCNRKFTRRDSLGLHLSTFDHSAINSEAEHESDDSINELSKDGAWQVPSPLAATDDIQPGATSPSHNAPVKHLRPQS